MPRRTTTKSNRPAAKKGKKRALGRGLDALIPTVAGTADAERPHDYFECDPDLISPNRHQPRQQFSQEELEALRDSIAAQGIIQPLLVRKNKTGFELVAGERRLRAARLAGLKTVPVVVKSLSDAEMLEMSIVENIQRENLNPMEEAEAYHRLMAEFKLTQDQVAGRVGKSRSSVANFLRLRQLPKPIGDSLVDGTLHMGHARAILGLDTQAEQMRVWHETVKKKLSVRETERLVNRLKKKRGKPGPPPPSSEDIYFNRLEETLSHRYGTKVQIKRRKGRGRVEIDFYSDEDLERLLNLLTGA